MQTLGFRTNPHNRLCSTLDDVVAYYQSWLEQRHSLSYQVDGVVIKVSPFNYQESLGVVGREPRWAIAYKFPAEQATTRLLNIGINVGRTGSLNPYAVLEPVVVQRRYGQAGFVAQRGGHQPQRHPGGRLGHN